jgi:6,7-dimethyl-8-ribityllumazine synthase
MLRKNSSRRSKYKGGTFAIVASKYNSRYVDAMLRAAHAELKRAGAVVRVVRVPGAYEIPVVVARLARSSRTTHHAPRPVAILCLGVILRGQTVHAAQIGDAVSRALMNIQLETGVPVIHEVLLLESQEQAKARCCDPKHNRGAEAAQTALEMARVMAGLAAELDDDVPF